MPNELTPANPKIATTAMVNAIIPSDYDAVIEFSHLIAASGLAPEGIRKNGNAAIAVAILHGMEIGFTPMAALQSIAVINGRPSVWGDGALALCQSSGLMEDFEETFEGEGEDLKAVCRVKRKGWSKPTVGEFSVADARAASLLDKAGPWKQYRKRMLKMRARAFALRDAFSDVFRGLAIAEEQQDVMRDITQEADAPVPPGASDKTTPETRKVEGEILEPKKEKQSAEPKRDAKQAQERKPAPKKELKKEDVSNPPAPDNDGPGNDEPDHSAEAGRFLAYVRKFEDEMKAAQTMDELRDLWKDRDPSFKDKEQIAEFIRIRDENKDRISGRPEPVSYEASSGSFDEEAFRSEFIERLEGVETADEALLMKEQIDALIENGSIDKDTFIEHYEDPITVAIERLP